MHCPKIPYMFIQNLFWVVCRNREGFFFQIKGEIGIGCDGDQFHMRVWLCKKLIWQACSHQGYLRSQFLGCFLAQGAQAGFPSSESTDICQRFCLVQSYLGLHGSLDWQKDI